VFEPEDLAVAITTRPLLFALDGLDEIANPRERTEVDDEIRRANARIHAVTRRTVILVATRPGSVGSPIWRDINFATLFLGALTPALRMKYLDRWSTQSKLTPSEVAELRNTFVLPVKFAISAAR